MWKSHRPSRLPKLDSHQQRKLYDWQRAGDLALDLVIVAIIIFILALATAPGCFLVCNP